MSLSLYSDGRSSERKNVNLMFGADGIRVLDRSGVLITFWSYDGLNIIGSISKAAPLELSHSRSGEARLTCEDHSVLRALKEVCPQMEEQLGRAWKLRAQRIVAIVSAAILSVLLFTTAVQYLAPQIASIIPEKFERVLSSQIAKRLVEDTGVCSESSGVKALDHLSNRITSVVSLKHPMRIQITDDARINSFAVSGGSIVVFRGMLEESKSSEEFAGLLAHEVAHNVERHPLEGMIRSLGLSFVISSYVEDLSNLAFSSADFKDTMVKLKYTPANEAVADALSVQILEAARISTQGLPTLFSRLRGDGPDGSTFSARHAHGGSDVIVSRLPVGVSGAALSKDEWSALKNICSQKVVSRTTK